MQKDFRKNYKNDSNQISSQIKQIHIDKMISSYLNN